MIPQVGREAGKVSREGGRRSDFVVVGMKFDEARGDISRRFRQVREAGDCKVSGVHRCDVLKGGAAVVLISVKLSSKVGISSRKRKRA